MRLNLESSQALAGTCVRFLPFDPHDQWVDSRYGAASTYAAWANPIAAGVRGPLDACNDRIRDPATDNEGLRLSSLRQLVDLGDTLDTRFDSIVAMARDLFGVSGAGLNFVGSDSQSTYAGSGVVEGTVPRDGTFESVTISHDSILIVHDTDKDLRFIDHTSGEGATRVRFYAGYPIEAKNGQRIGALYIVDYRPRAFSTEDASLLRELALRLQSLLWVALPELRVGR